MRNEMKNQINKVIQMESIDVVKADSMMDKLESKINNKNISDLFLDLEERDKTFYLKEIYVSLWSMLLYDKDKTDFILNQYSKENDDVKSKFKQIFNKTKEIIEDLESENMFDEGESPLPLLLSIEKKL